MANQSKFVLTVDPDGAVVRVQRLEEDGTMTEIQVHEFFSRVEFSGGTISHTRELDPDGTPRPPRISHVPPPDE